MPSRMLGSVSAILILLLLVSGRLSAQVLDTVTRLRLAQGYEQSGDYEQALVHYQELYRKEPGNPVFFEGVRRSLLSLKRYDDAIVLLRGRLASNPADPALRAGLGGIYFKAGNETEAWAEWEATIAATPRSQVPYRTVAAILIENRLLDRAVEIYRRGRDACGDPDLFTADIAGLLAVTQDYAGATTEYVQWLRRTPVQLGFVQGRMAAYTGREDGRAAAIGVVRNAMASDDAPPIPQLLGWLYLEGKQYAEAFEIYRTIDRVTHAGGAELYAFAERTFRDHAYEVAARAYREAIGVPVSGPRLPAARYGEALCRKELSIGVDSTRPVIAATSGPVAEAQSRYDGVIESFRGIIRDYPRSEFAARAWYQIGLIQHERLFDLDAARASFDEVLREAPGSTPMHHEVALHVGMVLEAKGDTAGAAARFADVAAAPTATPDQQDEATFRLAELAFFGGHVAAAIEFLNGLALNVEADYANDALLLLSFLQENNQTAPEALAAFGAADFLARQRKNTEAIPRYQELIRRYPNALLVDDALLRTGALQAQAGLYDDALSTYNRLLTEFRERSIALDRARFATGEIYQFGLNDRARAIGAYEQLLADYPSSLLVGLARTRIRTLRGDSL